MKLFKNKKGSVLVEKILMAAFAVAAGGTVVVYGSKVITNAKNTEITGILGNSGQGRMTQEQLDAHFNDTVGIITINQEELNTKSFNSLHNLAIENPSIFDEPSVSSNWWSSYIQYNNETWTADEYITEEYFCYASSVHSHGEIDYIFFGLAWFDYNSQGHGITLTEYVGENYEQECSIRKRIPFEDDMVWVIGNNDFYNLVKPYVIADLS